MALIKSPNLLLQQKPGASPLYFFSICFYFLVGPPLPGGRRPSLVRKINHRSSIPLPITFIKHKVHATDHEIFSP